MNYFTVYFTDLSEEKQADIRATLREYALEDLKAEAKESKLPMEQFMCLPSGYDLDPEFYSADLENFLDELVERRINENFKSLVVGL